MSINPYAPPQTLEPGSDSSAEFEQLRKAHLGHEASVKSAGILYWISAVGLVIMGGFWLSLVASAASASTPEADGTGVVIVAAIGVLLLSVGVFQFWVGNGLRKFRQSARIPTGILSGIGLIGFPLGTLINAYILYLVFSKKGSMIFSDRYKEIMAATPHLKYRTSTASWIVLGILVLLLLTLIGYGIYSAR